MFLTLVRTTIVILLNLVRKVKGFIEVFLTLVRFQPFAQKQEVIIVFYDRFAELCSKRNISANKAATDIGLSNSTVTKWKKTGAVPQTSTLSKIAEYFNVSIVSIGISVINLLNILKKSSTKSISKFKFKTLFITSSKSSLL